jgi:hypothetical protein
MVVSYGDTKRHIENLVKCIQEIRIKNRYEKNRTEKKKNNKLHEFYMQDLRKFIKVNGQRWINGICLLRKPGGKISFYTYKKRHLRSNKKITNLKKT